MKEIVRIELEEAQKVLSEFLANSSKMESVVEVAKVMIETLKKGGKIISCGNGGSLCDAMHFAEELTGRYRCDRKPLAAISLSDPSHITCTANDYSFDDVFSRMIEALGQKDDTLFAISTSGNSKNIIKAIAKARVKGLKVVCLSGKDGGEIASLCDAEIRVPNSQYSDRVQEVHIMIIHILVHLIETEII